MTTAVCILKDDHGVQKGRVNLTQTTLGVRFNVQLWNMPTGKHGFHVHRSGNLAEGSHSLCAHFTTLGKKHGDLNDPDAHNGDLGNLVVSDDGRCDTVLVGNYVSLDGNIHESIIGRSLVLHADEDDLGKGSFPDSSTTGHSGDRIAYGLVGINDRSCNDESSGEDEMGCSIF